MHLTIGPLPGAGPGWSCRHCWRQLSHNAGPGAFTVVEVYWRNLKCQTSAQAKSTQRKELGEVEVSPPSSAELALCYPVHNAFSSTLPGRQEWWIVWCLLCRWEGGRLSHPEYAVLQLKVNWLAKSPSSHFICLEGEQKNKLPSRPSHRAQWRCPASLKWYSGVGLFFTGTAFCEEYVFQQFSSSMEAPQIQPRRNSLSCDLNDWFLRNNILAGKKRTSKVRGRKRSTLELQTNFQMTPVPLECYKISRKAAFMFFSPFLLLIYF